jgi:hypothetical protein
MPTKEQYWKNKEKFIIKEEKEYHKNNPHKKMIRSWRSLGIKLREGEDWESVYLYYITCENCELCNVKLTDEKKITATRRCLDHDHSTGFIRNILCNGCNKRIDLKKDPITGRFI